MKYMDRAGNLAGQDSGQDRLLRNIYRTRFGRGVLKLLVSPPVSKAGGMLLNTKASKLLIRPFIRSAGIDLSQCVKQTFDSYNDFFMREMKPDAHPVDMNPDHLISPCDSKLTVYPIGMSSRFKIKNTKYTAESLLKDNELAKRYAGGYALVFRLSVEDYHHYCYPDDGYKTENRRIQGVFHTVNPAANDVVRIYKENTREYSILQSEHFGDIVMMEVGALMVGRIVNEHQEAQVRKGQEKGHFEFGGSTVILLLEPGKARIDEDLLWNTQRGCETKVSMGEKIGAVM